MINLLLFIGACYGITNILVFGSIFEGSRNLLRTNSKFFGDLVSCMMCTSFWVGALVSMTVYSPTLTSGFTNHPLNVFFDAAFASGVVWLLHTIQEYFEK